MGRSGTTFLVQLLTELGLDTSFGRAFQTKNPAGCQPYCETSRAGLETRLLHPSRPDDAPTPYIIKDPALCDTLDDILATGRYCIDHVYIPIRDLNQAAASRAAIGPGVPGGLWRTSDPELQCAVLGEMSHRLFHSLSKYEIPFTLVHFPRIVEDAHYAWRRLAFLVQQFPRSEFVAAHQRVARPDFVHQFRDQGALASASEPLAGDALQMHIRIGALEADQRVKSRSIDELRNGLHLVRAELLRKHAALEQAHADVSRLQTALKAKQQDLERAHATIARLQSDLQSKHAALLDALTRKDAAAA